MGTGTVGDLASIMSTGSMREARPPRTNQLSPAIPAINLKTQVEVDLHAGNPVATSLICFVPADTTPSSVVPYFFDDPFPATCPKKIDLMLLLYMKTNQAI